MASCIQGTAPTFLEYGALPAHSDFVLRFLPVSRAYEKHVGAYVGSPSSTGDE